ncbi:MAG: cobyrinate a,c-diamide synthase [Parvibaculum sp.]|uniref:cobyrinate a,c-diamide synthase n=1 Tax=Parvibaculum sp. TaxID=2024848 RepID=UPI0025F2A220|nr:cobyrinate a,c-diamide synthase [Parvibaculum sp.]MCE9649032.1 cobyrinate a,c-diamide synthase [Parvibaculum sp.]
MKTTKGLVVAAPRSGSGKTTLMLGLLRALTRRGLAVQPAKCGPDYIDPAFHTAATGRQSYNLDSWSMQPALLDHLTATLCDDADLVVCEGSMGLFDGVAKPGASGNGASADIAARTGWPVLLLLDVSGQSQSAGAIAKGFATFRDDIEIAGVILNRVASERHRHLCSIAVERAGLKVLGSLPRRETIILPERHLGLIQAGEVADIEARLNALADYIEENVDLDAIVASARDANPVDATTTYAVRPPAQRIALARDNAFSFVYPHILAGWRKAGAEILPFSPLADEGPDGSADMCWLPGGYPELHAGKLAANANFKSRLADFAARAPVHGECGGYMVLGETLEDADGETHVMLGLLGLQTSFAKRRMNLGYRLATSLAASPLGPRGRRCRGHEFHYSTVVSRGDDAALFTISDANGTSLGESGSIRGRVSGAFFHLIDIEDE